MNLLTDKENTLVPTILDSMWDSYLLDRADEILDEASFDPMSFTDWLYNQRDSMLAEIMRGNTNIVQLVYSFLFDQLNPTNVVEMYVKDKVLAGLAGCDERMYIDYDLDTDETFLELIKKECGDLSDSANFNVHDYCIIYFNTRPGTTKDTSNWLAVTYFLNRMRIKV